MKKLKRIIIFIIAGLTIPLHAQQNARLSLNKMVQAEFDFAKLAKDRNTKEAFLAFCNDSSIGFDTIPLPMKPYWLRIKADTSLLFWKPDFAAISASGELGFDAGPWQYFSSRVSKTPAGQGHFITLWKLQKNGTWSFAIDIGISYKGAQNLNILDTLPVNTKIFRDIDSAGLRNNLYGIESNLDKNPNFYPQVLTEQSRFYHSSFEPIIGTKLIEIHLKKVTASAFKPYGFIISNAKDMAATYGTCKYSKNNNIEQVKTKSCYLHLWIRNSDNSWKLAIEVISEK